MHRHRYIKHPEFSGLGEIVWRYLQSDGNTIEELGENIDIKPNSPNSNFIDKAVWYTKAMLDKFVERELSLNLEDYGLDKSKNPLYKAIANEIGYLRRNKLIVDLRRTKKRNAGMGIWRLDESYQTAKIMAERDMKYENFSSYGHYNTTYVREKQNIFKEILLSQYGKCLFCEFDLRQWMIGAHIVPYDIMRKTDPINSMNPANGLLLCRLCDTAFEYGHLIVECDYRITKTKYLLEQKNPTVQSWLDNMNSNMSIDERVKYKPACKYLRHKKTLSPYT